MQLADVNIFHIFWEVFSVEKFQSTFPSLQILRHLEGSLRWGTSLVGIIFVYRTDIDRGFFSSCSEPNTIGTDFLRDMIHCRWPLLVRAKSEVLITFTGTDSDYYNLLEDHSGVWKPKSAENPVVVTSSDGSRNYFYPIGLLTNAKKFLKINVQLK